MIETEDFERLHAAGIPPGAYRIEETSPELAKILAAALDRLIDENKADES